MLLLRPATIRAGLFGGFLFSHRRRRAGAHFEESTSALKEYMRFRDSADGAASCCYIGASPENLIYGEKHLNSGFGPGTALGAEMQDLLK